MLYALGSFLRVIKLKMLYPGIDINFTTRIERNCQIVCIKGGRLVLRDCMISSGTSIVVDTGAILEIHHAFVGRNCVISSKRSVTIAADCLIAEMVVIRDQDHRIGEDMDFHTQKFVSAPVEIREKVWIASKATILKGVTIGEGAIIAASAVVNRDVPPHELWGGIPAKFIKHSKPAI